jgi:hypothetical protein
MTWRTATTAVKSDIPAALLIFSPNSLEGRRKRTEPELDGNKNYDDGY